MNSAMVNLHTSGARLPVAYEEAKSQLAKCATVDECKDWADKAAALASYAKQSQDESLENMAKRIRARAIKRCGELLREIEPGTGAHLKRDGGVPLSGECAPLTAKQRATRQARACQSSGAASPGGCSGDRPPLPRVLRRRLRGSRVGRLADEQAGAGEEPDSVVMHCLKPTEDAVCFAQLGHRGPCRGVAYGFCSAGQYFVRQHSPVSFTVHYTPTGFSDRLLGSYGTLEEAVAGLARLKRAGIRR